ncbi:MAG: hypothetical protein ACTSR8_21000 [Promethearchaeota archaeon]
MKALNYLIIKKWINQKNPLLNGKTPKESIKDPKLRGLVLDLIKDFENTDNRRGQFDPEKTYKTAMGNKLR